MKVVFFVRANHDTIGGGDLTQIFSTAKALEKKGVQIEIASDISRDLSSFDIVHCFNSPRFTETQDFFNTAIRAGKPIAFSTIFWSKDEQSVGIAKHNFVHTLHKTLGLNATRRIWGTVKNTQASVRGDKSRAIEKWLFRNASILLPNSEGEQKELEKTYHLSGLRYYPVRNAIDTKHFVKEPPQSRKDYVLSVARIERRKNTKKLILACANLGLPLILVGGADKRDDYVAECLGLLKQYNFKHFEHMQQEQLKKYFYEARVHALVGWYETPGLSSLEAACGGCNILTTDRGSTKEYFKDRAVYCDPFSQGSIEAGLQIAWDMKPTDTLRNYVMKNYTWDLAADDTLKGYRKVIYDKK